MANILHTTNQQRKKRGHVPIPIFFLSRPRIVLACPAVGGARRGGRGTRGRVGKGAARGVAQNADEVVVLVPFDDLDGACFGQLREGALDHEDVVVEQVEGAGTKTARTRRRTAAA